MNPIELTEYQPQFLAFDAISLTTGTKLWREFSDKVSVEFPSPKTGNQWRLTALGWVGQIPLTPTLHLSLIPKINLSNLFRMWENAYELKSFHWFDGIFNAKALPEFYERVAHVLALQVLQRGRWGFYRSYQENRERLPYLRGQIDLRSSRQAVGEIGLVCRYEEHTADITDNQILAYTLEQIARSGRCSEQAQTAVRRATHLLQSITTPHSFQPQDCVNRTYTRLNQDYRPLHALCRFFLEHTGPTHEYGDHEMLPFLVNMARLYELFVAKWLKVHLPSPWQLKAQEQVMVGARDELQFDIDLVLYDGHGRTHAVLDTKYKTPTKPGNDDISQIVTYAKAKSCREAVLIYPVVLERPLNVMIGDIHLRSLTFALDSDLEQAGQHFINALLTP